VYCSPVQNTGLPSVLYTTPSDKVAFINANFEQQPDQRDVSTNVSHNNVMDSEVVDVKEEEDDVLSSFISSQLHHAAHDIFRGADVQQIDDAEHIRNGSTGNQVLRNSSSHEPHTAEKSYECDVCHKTFKYPSHFNEHKHIHTGVKPYVCDVCDIAFRTVSHLNTHTYVHSDIKRFTCHICNRAFKRIGYLTKHKHIHAGMKPKSYLCNVCNMAFSAAYKLNRHRYVHSSSHETHTAEKSYECDVCHKTFKYPSYLVTHKQLHTRVKP